MTRNLTPQSDDEGRQPELFSLEPPPPPQTTCLQCGDPAVVVTLGVVVCLVCGAGSAQVAAARRVAEMKSRGRKSAIEKSRRRRR